MALSAFNFTQWIERHVRILLIAQTPDLAQY